MSLSGKLHHLCAALNRFDILVPGFKPGKAYLNWLRANYEMARKVSRVDARPLKLNIEPTNACQLRCPLCPTGLRIMPRPRTNMRLDLFEKLLREVGDYVFYIDFHNWGEPLLFSGLEEMIRLARKRSISTTISTNLSLKVSDERMERLIASGLNHMIISLDGASRETVTQYRRGMDFDLVVDNMRRLTAMKQRMGSRTPYMSWQFLVFRFNEHELDRAREMALDLGVDRLMFCHASLDTDVYPLSDEDRALINTWVPSDPALTCYNGDPGGPDPRAPHKDLGKGSDAHRCDWLYVSSALNSDGALSPCCAVYRNEDAFSPSDCLETASYMDTYNNERFRTMRDRFAGRKAARLGVTCERCSSRELKRYGEGINRIILLGVAAKILLPLMDPLCRIMGKGRGPASRKPRTVIQWP